MNKDITYIAELCQNHNGKFKNVEKMVYECAKYGADIIKLQYIYSKNLTYRAKFEEGYSKKSKKKIIKRPFLQENKRLKKLELSHKELEKFIKICEKNNVKPAITCFAREHVNEIYNLGFKIIKVASYDCASYQLLRELKKKFKKIIVSTGATYDDEIKYSSKILNKEDIDFSLLHCVTIYPTPINKINLSRIKFLKKFCKNVGFSDHSLSDERTKNYASLASIYFGAKLIERHIRILDRDSSKDGPVSIKPIDIKEIKEFSKMNKSEQKEYLVKECNLNLNKIKGKSVREMSHEEILNRDYYRGRFASYINQSKRPIFNWDETPIK
ncbi:N-acetylneuraminate synthase family protein [Candidatus Pelagibacter sp.]|nr:N-acetylneuraminate synthase family protein [Candidatus Pelagibacter sp.]